MSTINYIIKDPNIIINVDQKTNGSSNLAIIRRAMNYSQAVLAERSGVALRTIQQYESQARDISKASFHTIWLLSRALECRPDELVNLEIDDVTRCIVARSDGTIFETQGDIVNRTISLSETKFDKHKGWHFDWKKIQDEGYDILELYTPSDNRLQGRISYIAKEGFYFVDHVESAPHNVGHHGQYIGVAANLFAIVCKKSKDHGFKGVVSFISKLDLKLMKNYSQKLGAKRIGTSQLMVIDEEAANILIKQYGLED